MTDPEIGQRPGLRGLLEQPAYRRLWAARTVSQVGDVAQFTTLALLIVALTGSALGVSGGGPRRDRPGPAPRAVRRQHR